MKKIVLISFLLVFSLSAFAQIDKEDFIKAHPTIGWDSLRAFIERPENYPEILRRAGLTGDVYLSLLIDSTGTLSKIEPAYGYKYVAKSDSLTYHYLIPAVEKILISIKWVPSYLNQKPITDKIYRSFNFILFNEEDKGFNIIAPKSYMKKSQ